MLYSKESLIYQLMHIVRLVNSEHRLGSFVSTATLLRDFSHILFSLRRVIVLSKLIRSIRKECTTDCFPRTPLYAFFRLTAFVSSSLLP